MKSLLILTKFTLILSYFSLGNAKGKANLMLHCLAKEETLFHKKKITGPYYKLNQIFVNELTEANDIHVKKKYIKTICHDPHHTPSVALLRSLILDGEKIFNLNEASSHLGLNAFKSSGIKALKAKAPHLLFSFLGQLQGQGPDPHCFVRRMPEVLYFLSRYKYLEEDYQVEKLLDDKKRLITVFNKLRNVHKIVKSCTDEYYKERDKKRKSKK